jgi:uncharacterized damage-inducible protein DinB
MASHAELKHLQKRLSDEGAKTAEFFAALAPEAWQHPVYSTGPRWKVRQVLAHFVSAERGYLHYMRDTVNGGRGVPRNFDIDAFNAIQVEALSDLSPAELLVAFGAIRSQTCEFVGTLQPGDLDRMGYHPWFGEESLRFLLKLIFRHPMLHVRDIRLAMETGAAVPDGEGYASFARNDDRAGGS